MSEPRNETQDGNLPSHDVAVSERERQQTVDRLRAHYVRDDIDVDAYERLVDQAWAARSTSDLDRIVSRLPVLAEPAGITAAEEATPVTALASPAEQKEYGFQLAILGGSERKGSWVPPKKMNALAIMGGTGLDFREARLGPGVTDVKILTVMGGAEVIVPPGVTVDASGLGIMGGFDGMSQIADNPDPSAPIIRIRGLAVMRGIEVKMMLPGESAREARHRVREDQKRRRISRRRD